MRVGVKNKTDQNEKIYSRDLHFEGFGSVCFNAGFAQFQKADPLLKGNGLLNLLQKNKSERVSVVMDSLLRYAMGPTTTLCMATIFLLFTQQATATRFVVGDASGWTSFDPQLGKAPDYEAWAASHHIVVNDTLLFNMSQAHQTLDQLFTQQDFDSCNFTISRTWANYTDTSFEARLTEPGYYFFSSSLPNHCVNGQKLRVRVWLPASPPSNIQGPAYSPHMAPFAGPAMSPHVPPAGFPVLSPHPTPRPSPTGSPSKAPVPSTVPPVGSPVSNSQAPGPSQAPSGASSSNVVPSAVILMMTLAALLLL